MGKLIGRLGRLVRRKPRGFAPNAAGPLSLAVLGPEADRDSFVQAFAEAGLPLRLKNSLADALEDLRAAGAPVVFYDLSRTDRPWQEAVSLLAAQNSNPCVMVLTGRLDQATRTEMVRCGGYDLLRTPLDGVGIRLAVGRGWLFWRNRRALRQSIPMRDEPPVRR